MTLMHATINKLLCFSRASGSAAIPRSITFYTHRISTMLLIPLSALRVLLGHQPLSINSTCSLLRSKLSADCMGITNF